MVCLNVQKGITFIETLMVIGIMVALVVFGYPSMVSWLHRMEAREVQSVLMMAVYEARVLSYGKGSHVIVCLAGDDNVCHKTAQKKILLFYDRDDNQKPDKPNELVKEYPLNLDYGYVEARLSLSRDYMKYFTDTGTPKGHFGHIKYCSKTSKREFEYKVVVSHLGGVRVQRDGCVLMGD